MRNENALDPENEAPQRFKRATSRAIPSKLRTRVDRLTVVAYAGAPLGLALGLACTLLFPLRVEVVREVSKPTLYLDALACRNLVAREDNEAARPTWGDPLDGSELSPDPKVYKVQRDAISRDSKARLEAQVEISKAGFKAISSKN